MRLIDADIIAQQMRELPHEYSNKEQRARTGGIALCQEIVREAPSIKTKQVIYYDEDEKVWKTGEVIVDE